MAYIGARVRRKEDRRLLVGGRYVGDLALAGQLHAAILRSPHAYARLVHTDTYAARALPGVAAVWTHADLPSPPPVIPLRSNSPQKPAYTRHLQPVIAPGVVRYVGEPVAIIVARSRQEAEDACEAVRVEYEPLPAVADLREPGDQVDRLTLATGDVEAAFAAADVVVRGRFRTNRHTAMPMETRGLLAAWDAGRGELTVWGPTKVVHWARGVLAGMLDLAEARVRFVEPDVGGGFGVRGEFYPEDFLVPYAARRLGRPVKWVEDRREHLLAANHSREQVHEAELAARADGTILGLRDRFTCDLGAYLRPNGMVVPTCTADVLPGPYLVPSYRCELSCVLTNRTPVGTVRGPGRYEATFVRERLLDLLAARLGRDPVELRRQNLVPAERMPLDRGLHVLDSGDYPALFQQALDRFGYDQARAEQAAARRAGRHLGIGVGCFVEKSALGPWEAARVAVDPSGEVFVDAGGASLGQGMETALAQICADALHVPFEGVAVRHGDTALVPFGTGSWSSRQTVLGGNAVARAAADVRERALEAAARLLESRPEDLELSGGRVGLRGTGRGVPLHEVARACQPPHGTGLAATAVFEAREMTYSFGVHLALVEVDPDTGEVRILRCLVAYDVGAAVNPLLIEGQIAGGCAQGIGGALLEHLIYDAQGQALCGTLMDYLLPSATEVPRIEALLGQHPTPLNPLGLKGAGEAGLIGVSGCLANAVADAVGAPVETLPLAPGTVWALASQAAP